MKSIILFILITATLFFPACGGQEVGIALKNVPVYKRSDQASKQLTLVKRGEQIKIIDQSDNKSWIKISLSDGETKGWILSKYLFIGKIRPITILEDTDWYIRPDKESPKRMDALYKGTKAYIIKEIENGWYKVNTKYGLSYEGWIQGARFENGLIKMKPDLSKKVFNIFTDVGKCKVRASRWLKGQRFYSPILLFDGKLDTSWQEGEDGYGIGAWIEIIFPKLSNYKISLVNGYVKKHKKYGDMYKKNCRVKKVKVFYGTNYSREIEVDFFDNDKGFQSLGNFQTKMIRIKIMEVYPGKNWKDTAISEIKVEKN